MPLIPRRIRQEPPAKVVITWSDDSQTSYSSAFLRNNCPCATCTGHGVKPAPRFPEEHATSLPVLGQQMVRVTGAQQIGHYAVQFRFSDGHDTGIYPYDYLRELFEFASKAP